MVRSDVLDGLSGCQMYNMGLNGDMAFRIMVALYMHGWAMRDWFGDGRDNE